MKNSLKHILLLALVLSLSVPALVLAQCSGGDDDNCTTPCSDCKETKNAASPDDCKCKEGTTKKTEMKGHPSDCSCAQCVSMKNTLSDVPVEKEGNVWVTEDGTKYYTCPVMNVESRIEDAEASSVINGVKYYHCCTACQAPFRAETKKWLKGFTIPGNVFMVDKEGQKHFRDPVNGDVGVVGDKTKNVDYEGYHYYFASKKTMKKFNKSPQNYMTRKGA